MPGQDGLALLEAFRCDEQLRITPVIMLTGSSERDLKRRALDLGAVDLLDKPVEAEDLLARLRSVVRLRRYQDLIRTENERLEEQVRLRTHDLERAHSEMALRLAMAGEFRDHETGAHVCRVALSAREIGRALGVDAMTLDTLSQAAALHDIGKIGIPDAILLKPGALTNEERLIMQTHCRIGWELLRADVGRDRELLIGELLPRPRPHPEDATEHAVLSMAASIALNHHERWDGTGYPNGKTGEEIPLEARIVAVADVFEALCHRRPYKEPMDPVEAAALIDEESGAGFDSVIVGGFQEARPQILRMFSRFNEPHRPRHEARMPVSGRT